MHTGVLLLDDGTALALVAVIAIVAVCLLALTLVVVVFLAVSRREVPHAAEPAVMPVRPVSVPQMRSVQVRRQPAALRGVEIDVPTRHADAIIHALQASGWGVADTGEVVATDEDEEGLTTISVDVPDAGTPRPSSGEEIH